ncbi:MAG: HEPN domain-containing protein [Acidobacteria bacterium]|nr:HEPN domain-containing protein [Acidobacteriota bacterium]
MVTHSLRRLVRESAATGVGFADLDEQARLLDQHYIPTRYPN